MKAFEGDIQKLAKPDLYFREVSSVSSVSSYRELRSLSGWQIGTIPDLKARFEAMVFRRRFDLLLAEVMPDLGILRSAALELRSSERLKEVLKMVLILGNTLNGGTFRGNAAGFQLDALTKVSAVQHLDLIRH